MVCDNGSTDESVGRLRAWARGEVLPPPPKSAALRHLTHPPVLKPVALEVLDLGANLGYARANNVALRSILARGDFEHVWLLNNDTVVAQDALSRLVERMCEKPQAGLCGSTLLFYDTPERVQALGGATYNPRLGTCRNLGGHVRAMAPSDPAPVEARMAYVMGASMLVSKAFLQEVGLLDEGYFLFFEELDWATRGRDRFSLAWAPQSFVYHKAGASTGLYERRYALPEEYHMTRSLLLYAGRHTPSWLPLIHLRHMLVLLASVATGRWRRAHAMIRLYVSFVWKGA